MRERLSSRQRLAVPFDIDEEVSDEKIGAVFGTAVVLKQEYED